MVQTKLGEISSFGRSDSTIARYLKFHSNMYRGSIIVIGNIGVLSCAHITCSMQITRKLIDCSQFCPEGGESVHLQMKSNIIHLRLIISKSSTFLKLFLCSALLLPERKSPSILICHFHENEQYLSVSGDTWWWQTLDKVPYNAVALFSAAEVQQQFRTQTAVFRGKCQHYWTV